MKEAINCRFLILRGGFLSKTTTRCLPRVPTSKAKVPYLRNKERLHSKDMQSCFFSWIPAGIRERPTERETSRRRPSKINIGL